MRLLSAKSTENSCGIRRRRSCRTLTASVLLGLLLPAALAVIGGCGAPAGRPKAPEVESTSESKPAPEIPLHFPVPDSERAAFAGSAACVRCHTKEAGQLETHHARTLAPVKDEEQAPRFRLAASRYEPTARTTYSTRLKEGRCEFVSQWKDRTYAESPEFAFGSGSRGVTYLSHVRGVWVENRLSYFGNVGRWDYTPGQQVGSSTGATTPFGRELKEHAELGCFACHSDVVVTEGTTLIPEKSLFGVRCESCHGPGKAHIAAVRNREPDLKMPRLAKLRDRISEELCGQCHRAPGSTDLKDPTVRSQLPRMQGLALAQSKCFVKSQGRLSCITCHDPHRDADRTSHAEYNLQCRSCHDGKPAEPPHLLCPRSPGGDCVSCHMPYQKVHLPTDPTFRTHWIKVWDQVGKDRGKQAQAE